MPTWQELSRIALLGTEHSSLGEDTLHALRELGLNVEQAQPVLLAQAAALYAQLRKAGFVLEKFAGEMPQALPAAAEPTCTLRSATHLQLILDGKYAPALPEFMAGLLENGRVLPAEHLPHLLQRPDLHEWWELIQPALGLRGRWLLAQHPDWKKWLDTAADLDWQTGTQQERLRLLRHLRQQNPPEALELLRSTWETEGHRERAAFLAELGTGLGLADEDFLEKCLDDRRKEVRRKAAALLTRLPGSEFAERMFQRAANCFRWSQGRLTVEPPDVLDDAEARDGILPLHSDWKGGARASYLGQVVSAVPPSRWELWLDMEPALVWSYFSKTDWAGTLGLALAQATHLHEDFTWLETLLDHWFEEEDSPLWDAPAGHQLMESAPATTVQRLALAYLGRVPGLPSEDSPLFQFLQVNDAPWEQELTLLLVGRFQAWLSSATRADFQTLHFQELLKMVSYRCSPQLYERLQQGWRTEVPLWAIWEKPVEELLEVVFFRKEMMRELTDG